MSSSNVADQKSSVSSTPASNRFERHPKLTLALILLVLLTGVIATTEFGLRLFHERLGLTNNQRGNARVLRLREWPPGTVKTFAAPPNRARDRLGPVDKTYELRSDEAGFIWPSLVHAKPDLEIVFLGGSTTECLYVRPEMRFPYLVGRMLEQHTGLKINSINGGKSGNHVMHAVLNYLGKVAPRRPRFVVLMEATNDIGLLSREQTYWNDDKTVALVLDEDEIDVNGPVVEFANKALKSTIPYTSNLVQTGMKVLRGRSALSKKDKHKPTKAVDQATNIKATNIAPNEAEIERRELFRKSFEPALRSFVRLVKAWGSEPILMTQVRVDREGPRNYDTDFLSPEALQRGNFDRESFDSLHDYANAIIRHVASTEDVMLIDLAARQWTVDDIYDNHHFTESGSRRAAEIIEQALLPHLIPAETAKH